MPAGLYPDGVNASGTIPRWQKIQGEFWSLARPEGERDALKTEPDGKNAQGTRLKVKNGPRD